MDISLELLTIHIVLKVAAMLRRVSSVVGPQVLKKAHTSERPKISTVAFQGNKNFECWETERNMSI